MENYTLEENVHNDFLSQSYSQGVERITGTDNFDPDFEMPEDVLEVREKTWNHLFDKYAEKPIGNIEVNIFTCKTEEEISEEERSCGQRIRIYKPASLIQYWINTGNPPYKIFSNENEDIGSSLSEEEDISSKQSSFSLNEEENNEQECRSNSSFSSVDTAAYILSNANITKKTDTIAIIEGAKYSNIKPSKNMKDVKTVSNDKIGNARFANINQRNCSGDNVNTNVPNTEISRIEHTISKMHTQPSIISTNTLQPNILQYSSKKVDKTDESSPKQLDVRNIHDIASIFQQFDKKSQRLTENNKENITLDQIKDNKNISDVSTMVSTSSTMMEVTKNDTTMTLQRKKLYTGRNSPMDLTLINRNNTNRLSQINHSLHPALDANCTITRKSLLNRKNKHLFFLHKKGKIDFKKRKRRKKGREEKKKEKIVKNSTNSSYRSSLSSFHNNSDVQDNVPFHRNITIQENNDTNGFVKDGISKQDLASLNLNPVILLERITPFFKQKSNFIENNHNMQENSVHNKHFLKISEKSCNNEDKDLQSETRNASTILIFKCKKNASQKKEFLNDSSSITTRLSDDDNSVENVKKKVGKLSSSSKDTVMILTKEPRVLIERLPLLPNKNINTTVTSQVLNKDDDIKCQKKVFNKSQMYLHGTNKIGNLNLKEVKISLSPIDKNFIDSIKLQIFNKNDAIQQKEVLRESEARFSNSYKTNNKDNVKLREIKAVLERLPTNICLKNTDVNLYSDKKKISQNTSLHNNKDIIESPIKTDSGSLKIFVKSKKDDKSSDTSDIVSEQENQVSDKVESNSTNYKCSILNLTSSDEDDFVKLLQKPSKRLKGRSKSIYDKTLNKTNTVNNKNLNTIIFPKEVTPRKINNSNFEKLNERDKTIPSIININNSKRSGKVIKRNEIDRKNNTNIVQTETDYTDSLYSEESNNHTTSRKVLKSASKHNRSRYSNYIIKKRLCKSSIGNRYIINSSNSSNSSIEEYNITNQSHNMSLNSISSKKAQASKQLTNEQFNDINLSSNVNNTKKNNKSFSFINDKQDTSVEKETFVNISFGKNNLSNLSENEQILEKSKSSAVQQSSIKPAIKKTKLLRFQTKSYYDSDSSLSS